jgi:hypothetical protein
MLSAHAEALVIEHFVAFLPYQVLVVPSRITQQPAVDFFLA